MKKNAPYLILFIVLIGIVAYLFLSQKSSSLSDVDFRCEDIKSVHTIELSDKKGHKMTLSKKYGGLWWVNENCLADKNKVLYLLEVCNKLQIESPISDKLRPVALDDLRKFSIKVRLLDEEKSELKTVHIGNTAPNVGNYMILESNGVVSPDPYVVKMPGFEGNLIYKFIPDTTQWKSTAIFNTDIDEIASISVSYVETPKLNFVLEKEEEIVRINPIHDSLKINRMVNKTNVVNFILEFENLHFETWLPMDSTIEKVKKSPKYATIKLVDVFGKGSSIILYRKPPSERYANLDAQGKEIPFDLEKYWAYLPDSKTYVLAQYFVLGPVLRDYKYFFEEKK